MQELSFHVPLQLAVAEGATTPNPGANGVVIWSTTAEKHLAWNGASWAALASGGGGTPGGVENSVQRKTGTSFNGSSGFTYDPTTGKLTLADTPGALLHMAGLAAEPTTPGAGTGLVYFRQILPGHTVLKVKRPSGLDSPLQDAVAFNRFQKAQGGGNALASVGFVNVITAGTAAGFNPSAGSAKTQTMRTRFTTATTANAIAAVYNGTWNVLRGPAVGEGGFRAVLRFSLDTLSADTRGFWGLYDTQSPPTNIDPATATGPGRLGIFLNSNTGNWRICHNLGGTAPTVVALGANFPINTTDLIELVLFCAPNGASVGYRVRRYTTNASEPAAEATGSLSTNLPAAATVLTPACWVSKAGTTAIAWNLYSITVESDW